MWILLVLVSLLDGYRLVIIINRRLASGKNSVLWCWEISTRILCREQIDSVILFKSAMAKDYILQDEYQKMPISRILGGKFKNTG